MVEDTKDSNGLWAKECGSGTNYSRTRSGVVWENMTQRCKVGGGYQKRNPSYIGCEMSELFKDFQGFANWYTEQVGYGCDNYDLDKDLLIPDNKIYSEATCVLVPHELNTFFRSLRGDMAGVFFDKRRNQIYSKIVTSEGQKRLGSFLTVEEASKSYKAAKTKEACKWADRILSGEYIVDARVVERLSNW